MTQAVLVSRQPIYCSEMSVVGYELLFRNGNGEAATFGSGAQATAQVVVNSLMDIGLEEIVGSHSHLAFINVEREVLLGDYCEALPHERVVLELLETVEPDAEIMRRLGTLRSKGYRIALDDFVFTSASAALLDLADYVKVDVLATDWNSVRSLLDAFRPRSFKLLAEKVETREQVERCRAAGFDLFQGYFFCRPQNLASTPIPANRLATLRLLALLNKPDIKIMELEAVISQDISLSYKLLRYINSAMCGLHRQVESIGHATVLVGLEKMRSWANLIILSGFEETAQEIIATGAIRARMCDQLANSMRLPHPEQYFLVGLFSVLDAMMDRPMPQLLSTLSLSDEINDALLEHKGKLGTVLRWVQEYERREWNDVEAQAQLAKQMMQETYRDAVNWSTSIVRFSGDSSGSLCG
jgi:EAL and modified HD-GYP domain-containing signal transduction protein